MTVSSAPGAAGDGVREQEDVSDLASSAVREVSSALAMMAAMEKAEAREDS